MIEGTRRVYSFSARIPAALHADLRDYADRHRRSLASAGTMLLEEALRMAEEQDRELVDRR